MTNENRSKDRCETDYLTKTYWGTSHIFKPTENGGTKT